MSLTTPTKPSKKPAVDFVDDERRSDSPDSDSEAEEDHELAQYRSQWIGEVDLPERKYLRHGVEPKHSNITRQIWSPC